MDSRLHRHVSETVKPRAASSGDDACVRRLKFIWRLAMNGLRWAKTVTDHVLLALALLGIAIGVAVSGVLLHRPAWLLGAIGAGLLLLILFEGAYRTWDEADRRANDAWGKLTKASSRHATADRLAAFAREGRSILEELPSSKAGPAEWSDARQTMASTLEHWVESVESEIRRNAPDLMPRWRDEFDTQYLEGTAWASAANIHELGTGILSRIDELVSALNSE